MDEEEFSEYVTVEETISARPMQKLDLAVVGIQLVRDVVQSTANAFETLLDCVAGQANYNVDRKEMEIEATEAIESIARGELDG